MYLVRFVIIIIVFIFRQNDAIDMWRRYKAGCVLDESEYRRMVWIIGIDNERGENDQRGRKNGHLSLSSECDDDGENRHMDRLHFAQRSIDADLLNF